jgi:predicted Zn-dependent protease
VVTKNKKKKKKKQPVEEEVVVKKKKKKKKKQAVVEEPIKVKKKKKKRRMPEFTAEAYNRILIKLSSAWATPSNIKCDELHRRIPEDHRFYEYMEDIIMVAQHRANEILKAAKRDYPNFKFTAYAKGLPDYE